MILHRPTEVVVVPRKKGARQPTLAARVQDETIVWQTVELIWYGGQRRTMEIATGIAVWFHNGKPALPIRWVLVRDPTGAHDTIALLCIDDQREAQWIAQTFVKHWQVEVTIEEARRHLGVESQRQWSDCAVGRTTPPLLGLFSWVTLVVEHFRRSGLSVPIRQSTWYVKGRPTFGDALALVRWHLWHQRETFLMSDQDDDVVKVPRKYLDTLVQAASYAA